MDLEEGAAMDFLLPGPLAGLAPKSGAGFDRTGGRFGFARPSKGLTLRVT
jgi:hypothetical protein